MKPVNRRNAQAYQKAEGNWKKKYRQIVKEKKKKGGGEVCNTSEVVGKRK